jgi:4'-phosphopantetheinyl transferase
MIPAASFPAPGEVAIWHACAADLLRDPARRERALAWLSPAERVRHDRCRGETDRAMFLVGRVMARTLVGRALGVGPTGWTWREGARGRPEIADEDAGLHFNLAHSGGVVACALSRGGEVGVDVEPRDRPGLDPRIVDRFCAPDEVADIRRAGPEGWRDQFLKYWTLKEAYLKARGLGLAVPLADLCFQLAPSPRLACLRTLEGESTSWAFLIEALAGRHWLAAATPAGAPGAPRFLVAPFPEELWMTHDH